MSATRMEYFRLRCDGWREKEKKACPTVLNLAAEVGKLKEAMASHKWTSGTHATLMVAEDGSTYAQHQTFCPEHS